jgi:hypothetical protein
MYTTLEEEISPFKQKYKTAKKKHMISENNVKLN